MNHETIILDGTEYKVTFEYEKDEPETGYKGGYSIFEVTHNKDIIWTPTISKPPHLNAQEIIVALEEIRLKNLFG